MKNDKGILYQIELCYIGEGFHGWQSQPSMNGIQDHMEKALGTFLRHRVRVVGASRTDSGVHAEHQVAVFRSQVKIQIDRAIKALNALTPKNIGILTIREMDDSFHPILSSIGKIYRYRLWRHSSINPFFQPYCWRVQDSLDLTELRKQAKSFIGRHDFSSFCAADSSAKTTVREIYEVVIDDRGPLVDIWVSGNGFLKQMVRAMVGTLVEFGLGKREGQSLLEIIQKCDRDMAGQTAPAPGLTLVKVLYDSHPPISSLIDQAKQGYCMAFSLPLS